MTDNANVLAEIRDLLVPISAAARMHLADEGTDRLRAIVGSGQRLSAAKLMDGTKTRPQIQRETKISAPNLSKLMKDLREPGLVVEPDGRPQLVIRPSIVWK